MGGKEADGGGEVVLRMMKLAMMKLAMIKLAVVKLVMRKLSQG